MRHIIIMDFNRDLYDIYIRIIKISCMYIVCQRDLANMQMEL